MVRRMSVVKPGPGPDLDGVVAELDAAQGHGEDRLVHEAAPVVAGAVLHVAGVHGATAQPGAWTWYSSFHQRAVRTSSGSVRSEGSWPRSAGVGPTRSAIGRSASRSKP